MRQTIIVIASTALVTAIIAVWGTSVIIANTQGDRSVGVTSDSADVTQLMRMMRTQTTVRMKRPTPSIDGGIAGLPTSPRIERAASSAAAG